MNTVTNRQKSTKNSKPKVLPKEEAKVLEYSARLGYVQLPHKLKDLCKLARIAYAKRVEEHGYYLLADWCLQEIGTRYKENIRLIITGDASAEIWVYPFIPANCEHKQINMDTETRRYTNSPMVPVEVAHDIYKFKIETKMAGKHELILI